MRQFLSELEEFENSGDASMLTFKDDKDVFNFMLAFMAKFDDDDNNEKTFSDFK